VIAVLLQVEFCQLREILNAKNNYFRHVLS
jgi:hypothetical protein